MTIQKIARVAGWILVIIGVLGYIPTITTNGMLFNTFHVDGTNNWFHIITGLIAIGKSKKGLKPSRKFFQIAGYVYLAVAALGFYYGNLPIFGMMASNMADSWLHLVISGAFLYIGYLYKGRK